MPRALERGYVALGALRRADLVKVHTEAVTSHVEDGKAAGDCGILRAADMHIVTGGEGVVQVRTFNARAQGAP